MISHLKYEISELGNATKMIRKNLNKKFLTQKSFWVVLQFSYRVFRIHTINMHIVFE